MPKRFFGKSANSYSQTLKTSGLKADRNVSNIDA